MQTLKRRIDESLPVLASSHAITEKPRSIIIGSLWMLGLTLALFFLPLVNGLIGGIVGGYKVGSVKRALTAALLPAALVALGLWILFSVFAMPFIGFLVGIATGVLIILSEVGIFMGAIIGGAISNKQYK